MKRSIAIALSLASGIVLSAAAQTLPTPAAAPVGPPKVAVIAFQVAVAQTNEGQRDFADLKKKFEPRQEQLRTLNGEVDRLSKELQEQGAKLTGAERTSREKAIDEKKKKLDRDAQDARSDFQQAMGEMYNGLASKVFDVLTSYAQQQGFSLILDGTTSQQQSPVVLYAIPSIDITKPVIEAYNVKSGVPAPPPPVAAPKPAATAPKPAPKTAPAAH
ncbi:MAG: OmpH family outer membrane protein [Terracidiphilus sp.]|jgi:outer membrane protein